MTTETTDRLYETCEYRYGNGNKCGVFRKSHTGIHASEHAALVAERERLVEVLRAAMHALRSYQYGNSSLDLAEEIADSIERILTTSEQEGGRRG